MYKSKEFLYAERGGVVVKRPSSLASLAICTLFTIQTLIMPISIDAAPFHQVEGLVATGTMNSTESNESTESTETDQTESQPTYTNPSHEEINELLETIAKEENIPSIILKAIAFRESSWRQFDASGQPLMNNRAIGIMQIATYDDNDQETIEKLKTDIEFNIRRGAELLNEKWSFTPQIGDGDRNILENWYFAIWAYNIWTDKNNPNVAQAADPPYETYQEKVYQIMAYPKDFLNNYIDPVEVTPLDPELFLDPELMTDKGIPDKNASFETPQPFHYGDLDEDPNGEDPNEEDPNDPKEPQEPQIPENPEDIKFLRLDGEDRIKTAINQALTGWPEGAEAVILARSDDFPDALVGVPLAAAVDGPILLTPSASLDPEVEEAMKTLNPEKVYLLGGENALSMDIEAQLKELGWRTKDIIRLAGDNRYYTAASIANWAAAFGPKYPDSVAIATGSNFPDALSIASIAGTLNMPIILTDSHTLSEPAAAYLEKYDPEKIYLIGGEGVIDPAIQEEIQTRFEKSSEQFVRLGGDNRYETMAEVMQEFSQLSDKLCFATGEKFPDALAGAALAARRQATVVLLPKHKLENYPTLQEAILKHPWQGQSQPVLFGGENAISTEKVEELQELLFQKFEHEKSDSDS
ncbi:MAG: transglycosylase SLT domain-containing protein [Desulfitobacterium sp.]|nr:transglycosylase SLT domain-containing protein [Desulfitobacterium sp.]